MTRRPNPSLSELARGPRTAPGECEAWLVARAVQEDRERIGALEAAVNRLRGTDLCIPPIHNRLNAQFEVIEECRQRLLALESPAAREAGERSPKDALAIRYFRSLLEQARRDLATQAEEHERAVRERDALHTALRRYGKHSGICEASMMFAKVCTCGLTDALAKAAS